MRAGDPAPGLRTPPHPPRGRDSRSPWTCSCVGPHLPLAAPCWGTSWARKVLAAPTGAPHGPFPQPREGPLLGTAPPPGAAQATASPSAWWLCLPCARGEGQSRLLPPEPRASLSSRHQCVPAVSLWTHPDPVGLWDLRIIFSAVPSLWLGGTALEPECNKAPWPLCLLPLATGLPGFGLGVSGGL